MAARGGRQGELRFRSHGGAREGAGRKARPERKGFVSHLKRPSQDTRHPLHISVRAVAGVPNLRAQRVFEIIARSIEAAVKRGHRILQFSVQHNHIHLLMEADPDAAVGRRMQRLLSRVAQLINHIVKRRGALWRDRYHRRDITSPRQMKASLVYVMFNDRKHARENGRLCPQDRPTLDACSSAKWFVDWDPRARPPPEKTIPVGPSPLARARTWLARQGAKLHGLIRFDAMPSVAP